MSLTDRFWSKVDILPGSCWLWTAFTNHAGYGKFWLDGTMVRAHRWAYESEVGPIPDGLEIDHLCRVRHCVNPTHLEPVTPTENRRRAAECITHCPQGHEYTEENTYRRPDKNGRECRQCHRVATRKYEREGRRRC